MKFLPTKKFELCIMVQVFMLPLLALVLIICCMCQKVGQPAVDAWFHLNTF